MEDLRKHQELKKKKKKIEGVNKLELTGETEVDDESLTKKIRTQQMSNPFIHANHKST